MDDEPDVEPAALFIDHDDEVPIFLRSQPQWWRRGLYGFRPPLNDPAEPTTWVFSRTAKAAFLAWQRAQGLTHDQSRVAAAVERADE
jgi:hypothetical protein